VGAGRRKERGEPYPVGAVRPAERLIPTHLTFPERESASPRARGGRDPASIMVKGRGLDLSTRHASIAKPTSVLATMSMTGRDRGAERTVSVVKVARSFELGPGA
jgi:hypothetical protein